MMRSCALLFFAAASALTPAPRLAARCDVAPVRRWRVCVMAVEPPQEDDDDKAPNQSTRGSGGGGGLDWDSAWKAEMQQRDTGTQGWRPEGLEGVSEVELAKIRAKKQMDAAGDKVTSMAQTSGPWLWLGVIAAISVATAFVGTMGGGGGGGMGGYTV